MQRNKDFEFSKDKKYCVKGGEERKKRVREKEIVHKGERAEKTQGARISIYEVLPPPRGFCQRGTSHFQMWNIGKTRKDGK